MKFLNGISPARAMAAGFGAIAGLSNLAYALSEILQGQVKPVASFFELNGQPAFTILPDMLWTGIVGICLSLGFTIYALFSLKRWQGGIVLLLIACAQIPFGAGLVRLFQAMLYGLIGTRIDRPLKLWARIIPKSTRPFLSRLWPLSFVVCLVLYAIHVLTGIVPSAFGDGWFYALVMGASSYGNLVFFLITLASGFARQLGPR